jgi:hypothetical protein
MKIMIKKNSQPIQLIYCLLMVTTMAGCYAAKNPYRKQIRLMQKGILKDDTSFVYQLPYEKNKSIMLIQDYYSSFSHIKRAALDFNMKKGTPVHAAKSGIVLKTKADGTRGGFSVKNRKHGNFIVIQHDDSTRTGYWHLQFNSLAVHVGDTVQAGQYLAKSGNTGYSYFPHLHFIVWKFINGQWTQVGSRFNTQQGIGYLKAYQYYFHK